MTFPRIVKDKGIRLGEDKLTSNGDHGSRRVLIKVHHNKPIQAERVDDNEED